ncbi:MAG: aromatic amino acid ammonia-lyase [Thermoleophilia bacterium]
MDTILIGSHPLTVEDVRAVALGARVEFSADAHARIRAGRAVVEAALTAGKPVYGLNTGVGHLKDTRLPDDMLCRAQETLVRSHAGGIGDPLPTAVVRAALVTRVNGISRGGSGASPAVAEILAAMLNAGVHPVVPGLGSVGAADLPQMAAIGLVAMGEGRAEYRGHVLQGAEALRRAGIVPLRLQPKDGLALISANGVSLGHGALVVLRAEDMARTADVAASLSLEAVHGNPSSILPAVGEAKPYPGQLAALAHMREVLEGSYLFRPDGPSSVQDPLSFRVAPQVHGALREFTTFGRHALETELDSMSDNPLVRPDGDGLIHNGNFHPIVAAIALDALRIAVAHVAQLSERRMSHLWDAFFASAPDTVTWQPGGTEEYFGLWLRYAAAAQLAELRLLAGPATLDVPPLDMEIEDHATNAPLTVRTTASAIDLLESLLSIELLLARDVISLSRSWLTLGTGTERMLRTLDAVLSERREDRSPAAIHDAVRDEIRRKWDG